MRQVREVVMVRQAAEWRRTVHLQEAVVQQLAQATHAAAGNKKGAKQASEIRFLEPEDDERPKARIPSTAQVSRVFKPDPAFGMITDEDIEAEVQRMIAAGEVS